MGKRSSSNWKIIVGNTGQLLKELNTQKAQVEALTLLKFEVERCAATEKSRDEVALLASAFNKVVSISKTEVEKSGVVFTTR